MYILYVFSQSQTFYIFTSCMKQHFFFLLRNNVPNFNRNQATTNAQLPRSPSLLADLATGLLCSPLLFSAQLLCLMIAFGGLTVYLSSHCLCCTLCFDSGPWMSLFLYQLQFSLILNTSVRTCSLLASCRVIQLPTTPSQIKFLTYFCALTW